MRLCWDVYLDAYLATWQGCYAAHVSDLDREGKAGVIKNYMVNVLFSSSNEA